ncbi:hypothetical protein PoB_004910400 [Plakobranchus ocellatus]|uniref:Uncharacterized protein n=1 Tax=Plakobranchus ocellatus TaxID=259542 RepID=A0AAV4BUY5_9GAST|nr:hypothetical protein PoB_004910400 [Plakobranchus ocellatus]
MFRNKNPKLKDPVIEAASEHPSGISREAMEASPGPIGAVLINRVRNFLTSTGIEKEFRNLLRILLSRDELPYNPYPGFAVRLRPFMEKFLIDADTEDKIEYALSVPLRETRLLNLFTAQEGGPVWGLRSILRVVDTHIINRYRWLADNITPGYDDLYQKDDYSNQVMLALVGAAIFHGSFYQQVHIAQFRQEFLITGSRADEAISIFVNSIMMDVDGLISSSYHTLIGVNVPVKTQGQDSQEVWLLEFWDQQNIQAHKGELMQKMSDAVLGSNYIIAECVFQLDPNRPMYIQGQKQYSLNFVEALDELREEGLSSFAEFPMASLHEGLFLNQTHAESYISMFTPQTDMLDDANVKHMSARPAPLVTDSGAGTTGMRRSSAVVEDDYHYIHRYVHQRLQHHRPRRARIDGFRLGGDDPGSGPFAWQVTTPFKAHLQHRVVSFHPWAQLFDIVYHMIILVLMERKTTDTPLLIELYRLCHSTAGKLHMVGERNKAVQALIRGYLNRRDSECVKKFLAEYKNDLDELLATSLHERSSDLQAVGRAISGQVSELMSVSDEELRTPTYLSMVIITLREQQSFIITTLMRLAEDILHWCPLLKHQIDQLHTSFPEYVPRPASNTRDPDMAGPRQDMPSIVVAKCIEREPSPKIIAKEAVLMRYIVDTHLDETWEKFLEESFQRQQPPLNPYPSFISKCRACAMKMDLFFEPEQNILERLLPKTSSLVDYDNFVYQVPGCEACGRFNFSAQTEMKADFIYFLRYLLKFYLRR